MDLPPELWMHIATLSDTPTAAGLVRANCTFRSLLQQQLDARLEARRLEREQAVCAKLGQMHGSIAAFSVYTMGNGSPAIRVDALDLKSFTCHCCPVGRMLPIGVGCGNVIRPLLSKNHWAAFPPIANRCMEWALIRPRGVSLQRMLAVRSRACRYRTRLDSIAVYLL